ncbi:sensor domain-containing diguanylate cyclase [Planomonospora venezuelensis]|uniref:Diguanylate cyclase (GGDEF)-like protein n=1 Tax=Planomonospora venezuelensis TaxID=1999 RepID=A0A841DBL5_PLAVE|nr:tetratricopeptide repeat-containing diguanylate cyclase [Planomonospora venezuelensis]MBB5965688.1 diguanylate cyclase (GGDEF)-like protein [Planomonospora venezuelensis]
MADEVPGQASRTPLPGDSAYAAPGGPVARADARAASAATPRTPTIEEISAELDVLESMSGYNIEAAYDRAVELERISEGLCETVLALRAKLVQVDVQIRWGELASVVPVMWQVNAWAVANGCRPLLARSHLLMARAYWELADMASVLEHMVSSMEALDESTLPRIRLTHLMKLADALDETGSVEASRERYRQAERLAATIDVERHVTVLNNLAYAEYKAGRYDVAWEVVERLLAISEMGGYEPDPLIMDTVSRVQIALGHYPEAVMAAQTGVLMHESQELTHATILPEVLLTLALAQRHMGDTKNAQKSLDRSRMICEEHGYTRILVQVRQEQAELHAASNDYRRAFEAYKVYHATEKELVSIQQEARARTRQAMFEAAEARQEAELFREQARRDPLTGLRNRRYVDEHLPAILTDAAATGGSVTIALVDLDHFKRINDTCSHDVGDQVLVAISGMLEAVPAGATPGFAARMGGEEFLLVMAGVTPTEAVARLEDLRASVAARSWRSITGDLPVTVSIGITASQADSTQAELLALADANLYTAKHKGRNRVCATSGATGASLFPAVPSDRRRHRDAPPPPAAG